MPFVQNWMNFEGITLGEMSQIEKKLYDLICMCKLKKPNSQKLKVDWWFLQAGE